MFFYLFVSRILSVNFRDVAIGEWDVFFIDSDSVESKQTEYTIEFHPTDVESTLNGTLWQDGSMSSVFRFDSNPLIASLQLKFGSDLSGTLYRLPSKTVLCDFDISKEKILKFSIDGISLNIEILANEFSAEIFQAKTKETKKYMIRRTPSTKETKHSYSGNKTPNSNLQSIFSALLNFIVEHSNGKINIDQAINMIVLLCALFVFQLCIYIIYKMFQQCCCPPKKSRRAKRGANKKKNEEGASKKKTGASKKTTKAKKTKEDKDEKDAKDDKDDKQENETDENNNVNTNSNISDKEKDEEKVKVSDGKEETKKTKKAKTD